MNHLKSILFVLFLSSGFHGVAQELLTKVPKKKEFKASEPNFIASVNWIQSTPYDQQLELHSQQYSLIVGWVSDSPTVTLTVSTYIMDYMKINKNLLVFFMGGWAKYSLENNYSSDAFQGNLAGLRSMINIYKTGKLQTDSNMQKTSGYGC